MEGKETRPTSTGNDDIKFSAEVVPNHTIHL